MDNNVLINVLMDLGTQYSGAMRTVKERHGESTVARSKQTFLLTPRPMLPAFFKYSEVGPSVLQYFNPQDLLNLQTPTPHYDQQFQQDEIFTSCHARMSVEYLP